LSAARELVLAWLEAMPQGEFAPLADRIAEDFVLRLPFAPPGVPSEFRGREVAQAALGGAARGRSPLVFSKLTLLATEDPDLYVASAEASATMASGKPYRNSYAIFVRLRDGKIAEHVEYLNPLAVMAAMGS
jgi:uncharacterized protein